MRWLVLARNCGRWQGKRGILAAAAAAAVVWSATVLHAALPTAPDVSGGSSLAGQLLIAAPALAGSGFDRTVVLVVRHGKAGAFGIVINRPLDSRPIASLLEAFGADASGVHDSVPIYLGGPVSPTVGLVIHSADYHLPDTLDIDGRVALSAAGDVLRDIGLGVGPNKSLIAFGYAGWAPQQLEGELKRGDWYTVAEDPALVFDDDRAKVWDDAMARRKSDH